MKSRRNEVIELLLVGSAAKLEVGMDQRAFEMMDFWNNLRNTLFIYNSNT